MPAPSTTTFCGDEALDALRATTRAVDLLHVEEERLDHVLGDLAGGEVDEVATLDLDCAVEIDLGALDGGSHDVVRRRVIGALELLAQVGREAGQVHGQRRGGRGAAGDLVALDVPRLLGVRIGADPALGSGDEVVARRHDLVDQAEFLGLRGAQLLALHEQAHQRVDDAEHAHGAGHAAAARQQAELDLGEAELELGIVDRDAMVAGQRDLEAAAQRGAVERRDDGLAERLQPA